MKTDMPEFTGKRMQREAKTVELMIRRYCRDKHHAEYELCEQCEELPYTLL
jgi:hypothetical protein